ncbi:MAG TPA: class II fructose-bisphosphate aldolase [Nocardioides sp.]|uniref:class II fructose-bisphosphate aldolase n=1 Tax=Nocardioides sp. TaxID=35761 RepID=UPI002F3F1EBA
MSLTTTGDLVAAASARGAAVAAVNVITLEHAEAIVAAAVESGRSLVLQLSENALAYHGGPHAITGAVHALAEAAPVALALHLDHLMDPDLVTAAVSGPLRPLVGSLMYDAGALPYAENVARTREVATAAHAQGLWVEAELGFVGGKADAPRSAHEHGVRTDPAEAEKFVAATGVDALAVAVGSSHAMTERTARLDHHLIAQIADRVPVPLVLHGSSGVPDEDLRRAVTAGVRKVNVGTALNVALTTSLRATLEADPSVTDPRRYLAPARTAMRDAVLHLLDLMG